jgi:alpha-tubulin suppressor-like RCC1 family protein
VNNYPFLIRGITPEGIYISTEEIPTFMSLLVPMGDQLNSVQLGHTTKWQVYQYQVPHSVTFDAVPVDFYSTLPPEIIFKTTLPLDSKEIQALCLTSHRFNAVICENEYFWKRKFIYDYRFEPSFEVTSWKELYLGYGVYAFGSNLEGELGLGHTLDKFIPTQIPGAKAKYVAAGLYNSLILDLTGHVFAFGSNIMGQSGLGDARNQTVPTLIPNIRVQEIATEGYHSIILDLAGRVFVFGNNARGQLGLGDLKNRYEPTLVPNIMGQQVATGQDHSLIIDSTGKVYDPPAGRVYDPPAGRVCDPPAGRVFAFGDNKYGQLGLGDYQNRLDPTSISNIKAQQVAAGDYHSLILDTTGGRVFAFGDNEYGQLGLGHIDGRFAPTMIPNIKAQQIAAGNIHSFIIDLEGNVYAFGSNEEGQLGLGDYQDRHYPTMIPNIKARKVSAGIGHSLIIDLEGNVYAFGNNEDGQLGLGHIDEQNLPVPSLIPGIKAHQVAAGFTHSLIVGYASN